MGCSSSRVLSVSVPEKDIMDKIIARIMVLEEKVKKGESLTRLEEQEKIQLNKVSKQMKLVQNYYSSKSNPL